MADFYAKMQGIASNLLTRFNQGAIELGVVTPGTGPAHNPGPSTTAWTALKGAANAAYSVKGGSNAYADGSLIRVGDLKVTAKVEALAADPKAGDLIRFGGTEQYRVIQFNKVPATGTVVAWVFYVRRG